MHDLIAPLIDSPEVREKPPTAALFLGKQDWCRVRAGGMSNQTVSDHLLGLLVDDFLLFRACAVCGLSERGLVRVFHVRPILDQRGFAVVAVMLGKGLFVLDLEEVLELLGVWLRLLRQVRVIDLERLCSRRNFLIMLHRDSY